MRSRALRRDDLGWAGVLGMLWAARLSTGRFLLRTAVLTLSVSRSDVSIIENLPAVHARFSAWRKSFLL